MYVKSSYFGDGFQCIKYIQYIIITLKFFIAQYFYPRSPTGIVVVPCVRPSVCPAACLSDHPERRYRSNSLRISAIGLKFGGVVHINNKHICKMAMFGQYLCVPRHFEISHDRFGLGLRDSLSLRTLWGLVMFTLLGGVLSQWCIIGKKFLSQGYIFLPKSLAKGLAFWC